LLKGEKDLTFQRLLLWEMEKVLSAMALEKPKKFLRPSKKATDLASRSMEKFPLKEGRTIHQDVHGTFGAGKVLLRSAPKGTGVIAGGAMRSIFEVAGIQDVVAKALRSTNPHNVVKATLSALRSIETPRTVAMKRGRKVADLFNVKTQQEGEV